MTAPKCGPGEFVLGFGNSIDYELRVDAKTLNGLIEHWGISASELSTEPETCGERALVASILAFMREGRGGERWLTDAAGTIEALSARFERRVTLGGNAVRAAIAMRKLGFCSTVHLVCMNDRMKSLLPEGCEFICSAVREGACPHLIIQYDAGLHVAAGDIDFVTDRSNRIIYVDDVYNSRLLISEKMLDAVSEARLLMVSGLNGIKDPEDLEERLTLVRSIIAAMPSGAAVFYEDTSLRSSPYHARIMKGLDGLVTIHSLNEDEMQEYLGCEVELLDPVAMAQALRRLRGILSAGIIVVHTRHYALAMGEGTESFRRALRSGADTAGTRYRLGDDYCAEDVEQTAAMSLSAEGSELAKRLPGLMDVELCCEPSRDIRTEKATTIGLGDAFAGGFLPYIPR